MVDVIGSPEFNRSLFGDSKALRLKTTGKILIYHDFIVDDDASIESFAWNGSFSSNDFASTEANAGWLSSAEDDTRIEAACDEVQRYGCSGRIFQGLHLPTSALLVLHPRMN